MSNVLFDTYHSVQVARHLNSITFTSARPGRRGGGGEFCPFSLFSPVAGKRNWLGLLQNLKHHQSGLAFHPRST